MFLFPLGCFLFRFLLSLSGRRALVGLGLILGYASRTRIELGSHSVGLGFGPVLNMTAMLGITWKTVRISVGVATVLLFSNLLSLQEMLSLFEELQEPISLSF